MGNAPVNFYKNKILSGLAALSLAFFAVAARAAQASTASDDPFIWLEDAHSRKALAWVEEHNKASLGLLGSDPRYKGISAQVREPTAIWRA